MRIAWLDQNRNPIKGFNAGDIHLDWLTYVNLQSAGVTIIRGDVEKCDDVYPIIKVRVTAKTRTGKVLGSKVFYSAGIRDDLVDWYSDLLIDALEGA